MYTIRYDRLKEFNLEQICLSGQVFRWQPHETGFVGVVEDKQVLAVQEGDSLVLSSLEPIDVQFWANYFDLQTDYSEIKRFLSRDEKMREAIASSQGMRILRQQVYETIISFIVSANNNVKRISGIIEKLAERYGEKKQGLFGEYYAFPNAEALSKADENDLRACGLGYRTPYIKNTAKELFNGFDTDCVSAMSYSEAKKYLQKLQGVGPKVAECILLYGYGFVDAFPIDVWIARLMRELYLNENSTRQEIEAFAAKQFGCYGGIAQQYLFYYGRIGRNE